MNARLSSLPRAALLGAAAVSLVTASCSPAGGPAGGPAAGPGGFRAYDARAREILAGMTLAEKIGQMTQADHEFIKDPADVQRYFLGSVLSGGSSDPASGNRLQDWQGMYQMYQQQAMRTRLRIPLLYGVDAVHGHNNVLGAVVFPHNIGLGATRNPRLVQRVAEITADEVRATGPNWAFAPCICVPRDERWGRTYEGFAEDPELVSTLGAAAVRGLQGRSLNDPLTVVGSAKHFAGDGGTSMGTGGPEKRFLDQGDARMDEATLRAIHIHPYREAVAAGVGTIMPSYNSWNGVKVSGIRFLLTDVLKGELGFDGFLISDYRAVDQVDPDYKTAIEKSINAGMDMVMVPDRYPEFIRLLTELVNEGRVPLARIDDAVVRILRVKLAMGLMDPAWTPQPDAGAVARFGSAEHRAVARQAVRESMVLLKNERGTLPIARGTARVHVAGRSADNLGFQTGGWTIDWQGKSGELTPGGTTVLAAVRRAVGPGSQVTFSQDGSGAAGADVGVVVIGEPPYAEGQGDRADLSLAPEDVAAVAAMKAAGIPVVVVLISGRPMVLGPVLDQADALIAAWLPGTEGDGVADVLFGTYRPTGKLPYSWPRSNAQIPINQGDASYDPLFPYGFGLTY
jgi:beta-glucosidase